MPIRSRFNAPARPPPIQTRRPSAPSLFPVPVKTGVDSFHRGGERADRPPNTGAGGPTVAAVLTALQVHAKLERLKPGLDAKGFALHETGGSQLARKALEGAVGRLIKDAEAGQKSPAEMAVRTQQLLDITDALVVRHDPDPAVDEALYREVKDLQGSMIATLLEGTVPFGAGLEKLRELARLAPPEGLTFPADMQRGERVSVALDRAVGSGLSQGGTGPRGARDVRDEFFALRTLTNAKGAILDARPPFRAGNLAGPQLVAEKLATLEPLAEGTRTLKLAFDNELARVNEAVAKGTMSTADVEKWSGRMAEVAATIIPGGDPLEVVGRNSGVISSQKKRVNMEARNDWSLTTRTEAQDIQCHMIAGLLAGKVPWDAGLEQIRAVGAAVPQEGKPQTLEERGAMLHTIRGPGQAFWAAAQNPQPTESTTAPTLKFSRSSITNPVAFLEASSQFGAAVSNAQIGAEYKPVRQQAFIPLKDASWNWKNGDQNPLHYFAVDVRNPTTGKGEQNIYHLEPSTGVLTQVSNLDAQGRRTQEPKGGLPLTAGPRGA